MRAARSSEKFRKFFDVFSCCMLAARLYRYRRTADRRARHHRAVANTGWGLDAEGADAGGARRGRGGDGRQQAVRARWGSGGGRGGAGAGRRGPRGAGARGAGRGAQARDHLGVAAHNGKIYTFGGFTSSVHQGAGDVAFAYDPANDRWQTLAPMKAPRAAVGVTVLAGKIHVIGGRGLDGVTVATHE